MRPAFTTDIDGDHEGAGQTRGAMDAAGCDREPIQIPGTIQPHGMLLAIDRSARITHASVNLPWPVPGGARAVTGLALAAGLPAGSEGFAARLVAWLGDGSIRRPGISERQTFSDQLHHDGGVLHAQAHRTGDGAILELEHPVPDDAAPGIAGPADALWQTEIVDFMQAAAASSGDWPALARLAARRARRITGFDRVLVYRFDAAWNGSVVAEDGNAVLEPLLGLHFPASDIPAQARALYRRTRIRMIPDAGYAAVPIVPDCGPGSVSPLDMQDVALRGISPLHLLYMQNMGTMASMSASLIIDDRLWGLLACHSRLPHRASVAQRNATVLLAQALSAAIATRDNAAQRVSVLTIQSHHDRLLAAMATASVSGAGRRAGGGLERGVSKEGGPEESGPEESGPERGEAAEGARNADGPEPSDRPGGDRQDADRRALPGAQAMGDAAGSLLAIAGAAGAAIVADGQVARFGITPEVADIRAIAAWLAARAKATERLAADDQAADDHAADEHAADEHAERMDGIEAGGRTGPGDRTTTRKAGSNFYATAALSRQMAEYADDRQSPDGSHERAVARRFGSCALQEVASGLLAISISEVHPDYIMWFRPEQVATVDWAGEPAKLAMAGPDGMVPGPRTSFALWRETVRGSAVQWSDLEVAAVSRLRQSIVSVVLRRAEEMALLNRELVRTNKELEAFSYSISHDLRAPFRHVVGYSELLREHLGGELDETGARFLSTISGSAEQAGRLVDDLLHFSRLGRTALSPDLLSMNKLVDDCRRGLELEQRGRAIEWRVDDLPSAWADAALLRQAVLNLLSNAVKYTRGRAPAVIEISGTATRAGTEYAIRDNGVGFDMAYAGKLFGVFQRLHLAEHYEGTGIGLALTRRIIERHGGAIDAEGTPDRGACFRFRLPLQQSSASHDAPGSDGSRAG